MHHTNDRTTSKLMVMVCIADLHYAGEICFFRVQYWKELKFFHDLYILSVF